MGRIQIWLACLWLMPMTLLAAEERFGPAVTAPPAVTREFRGAWMVTVGNVDWPSKPGLSVAEQKAELISLLDHAAQLKLNAVIFQVRPSCDALYASSLEPWSEYLTGTMGQPPEPFYDPLAFAITEAHRRGLALHAWLNPFRALTDLAKSAVSANHISRTHPEWVRRYGNQLWLDPGEPAVREHVWRVVQDVVLRYDVDGVQFDDYFYPYPTTNEMGGELEFPDEETWRKFGLPRKLSRDDWRRANINQFVQGAYATIKAAKPQVQFGISPFGIWRPMNPLPVRGLDAYAKLYADSRGWLINGWLDYFSPQLYWATDSPQQSFPALLSWWTQQNVQQRSLWPGLSAANVGVKFPASEIARQIAITRQTPGASGEIIYHLRDLIDKPDLNRIVGTAYAQPALPPVPPSLQFSPPGQPRLVIAEDNHTTLGLRWESSGEPAWWWVLQCRSNQVWTTEILPAARTDWAFAKPAPEWICVSAADRAGNLSPPATIRKFRPVPIGKGTWVWR